MKKITLLSLVAVLLTALTFTSCNTGDDNGYSYLTKEQQNAYQTKMAGSYSNLVLLFDHKNDADVNKQIDSVETSCNFSMRKIVHLPSAISLSRNLLSTSLIQN